MKTLMVCAASSLLLTACGGGGGAQDASAGEVPDSPYRIATLAVPSTNEASPTLNVPASQVGAFCMGNQLTEVFGGMRFVTPHPYKQKAYGCLIVNSSAGHPVLTGSESMRFELGPNDCSAGLGFDDCANDRSRHEIQEDDVKPTTGRVLTYDTNVYIPVQPRFRPAGCCHLLTLAELTWDSGTAFGVLAYLGVDAGGKLFVRTHQGFNYDIRSDAPVLANPFGRWVNIRYEIKSTTQNDGYVKVYVDGTLKVEQTRPTLPTETAFNNLRLGIFNSFKSWATEPYAAQVFYVDGLSKTVR